MAHPVKNPLIYHPLGTCHLPGNQKPDLTAHPLKPDLTAHPLKPDLTAHPLKQDLMVHPVKNPLTCHPHGICHHPGNQKPDLMAHLEKNPLTCHPLGIWDPGKLVSCEASIWKFNLTI